jgi:hypothetical protein
MKMYLSLIIVILYILYIQKNLIICENPLIIIGDRSDGNELTIFEINYSNQSLKLKELVKIKEKAINKNDFQYDYNNKLIITSQYNKLYKFQMNSNFTEVYKTNYVLMNGLIDNQMTYDWIHQLLYIQFGKDLHLISINDTIKRYVIELNLNKESLFTVNPIDKFLIWTDDSGINKANQDGTNHTILHKTKNRIYKMTIDFVLNRILFVEYGKQITIIDFNGLIKQMLTIKPSIESVNLLYSADFDYYNNCIYYLDRSSVYYIDLNIKKSVSIGTPSIDIKRIKLIHSSLQPNGSANVCLNSNCSHLCVPQTANTFRCLCPNKVYFRRNICDDNVCEIINHR